MLTAGKGTLFTVQGWEVGLGRSVLAWLPLRVMQAAATCITATKTTGGKGKDLDFLRGNPFPPSRTRVDQAAMHLAAGRHNIAVRVPGRSK